MDFIKLGTQAIDAYSLGIRMGFTVSEFYLILNFKYLTCW